ncbi:MAG: nucleotide exchange factor GrpE [Candidatus Doudnabacteria bacterium RIFCSPLOWO2_01_FULL_44_21]|uniref:Protein GrpE n=1 Tax=Candidatus Doudnabacteria bacterium RIFCSPLOWO2_01_FULL_44_21 TaxID=1817841 RepID=A0A1F5Q2H1_9BACT|nr:MAG: nucleotide exchange factor GrpE [Candidatus Doudnabacteria bacterium RIFCSPHIGHO2_02_FULL_43_13b]OGE96381.1 MAG: nucleotide exchange factor GrpE [Candidatus Doudnabacteria bacterium RIFCSPLOWO2_01_FULL_44_21]
MTNEQDQATTPDPIIEELKAQNEELTNNWKRAAADLENYRKRVMAERTELLQHAKELTVLKLLPSLQSLEQVLRFAPDDEKYKDWIAGLRATIQQLEKTMEELGVVKVKTVGEPFDPTHHEAVEERVGEAGRVLAEAQPGFMLNNIVIIPAKVVVGKNV